MDRRAGGASTHKQDNASKHLCYTTRRDTSRYRSLELKRAGIVSPGVRDWSHGVHPRTVIQAQGRSKSLTGGIRGADGQGRSPAHGRRPLA